MAWQKVASFSGLIDGCVINANVDGTPIAIYRLGDEVYATHGICTHALAFLSQGFVEDGKIECPLHQGQFDIRSGKALCAPVTQDLRVYPVRRDGDDILVDVDGDAAAAEEENPSQSSQARQRAAAESTDARRVVVVGAGQAAAAAIHAMREAGFSGPITLVGDEPHLPYERPPLSKDLVATPTPSYRLSEQDAARYGVRLHLGARAQAIDPQQRQVRLANGETLAYDALLLTLGGRARRLDVPGADLPGVLHLRTIEDAAAIAAALDAANAVAIVGGGFIGLELASAAVARGVSVTMLEREAELMARLLPPPLGAMFRMLAESKGVAVRRSAVVEAIVRSGGRLTVQTSGGPVTADAVLVGIGLEPETVLAAAAGCACDGGIVVDGEGRTSVAGIWAAGDCALHHQPVGGCRIRLESWQNAEEQGAAAGRSIAEAPAPERRRPWFWTDQFGLNIQILGLPGTDDLVAFRGDAALSPGVVYRTIDRASGRLTGIVALSNPQAIRDGHKEFGSDAPFDLAAVGATLLPQQDGGQLSRTEETIMNINPAITPAARVWNDDLTEIPDWIYTDQAVYDLEVEKIFHGRTWNFVALEAEIPEPGSFIRSNVGPTPVVVARADDGSINVFENRCAHRAAEFCRELRGRAKEFVCPYHQWSYDLKGNLAGIPFRRGSNGKGGMPADFKPAEHGPRKLNVTAHRGVVFASYADDIEPLADYFGPEILKEFEATFDGRQLKVLGHYRHTLPGNWKLYHENLRDPYHATLLHTFLVTFGLLSPGNRSLMLMDESGRHGYMASAKSDAKKMSSDTKKEMRAYREGMTLKETRFMDFIEEFDSPWSVIMATVWPNLIIQREMNTLGIRHIVPTGPHEFIMKWTMFGFADDDEEMTRHRLRQGNLMGPAGFLGLEDNEAIKFVQDGMQRVPNGRHLVKLDPAVPAGTSDTVISESAIRAMYRYWRREMGL